MCFIVKSHITHVSVPQEFFNTIPTTFTKYYYRYKDLLYKYNSTCRNMIKKGISHPCFYGNVINKVQKLKFDSPKVVKVLLVKATSSRFNYQFILYIYLSIHIILLFYVQCLILAN